MSLEPYDPEPLPDSRRYIRLVKIHPASNKDPLTISVEAYERSSAPEYTALSYTWGDKRLTKGISANGKLLLITENCWYALGQLRLNNICECYWVDAICINQADDAEKSAQVNLMVDIYQNAALGAIAVGRHDRATEDLFRLTKGLGITQHPATTKAKLAQLDHETLESLVRGFIALGTHPYWSRLWIVQEFALLSNVILLRGSSSVPFDIITAVNNALREMLRERDPTFMARYDYAMLESTPMSATMRLRRIIRDSPKCLITFPKFLDLLGPRECDDIRDRIFGILSLVQRSDGVESLAADYSLSRTELAIKTLRLCIGAQLEVASRIMRLLNIGRGDPGMLKIRQHRMLSYDRVPSSRPLSVGQRVRFMNTAQAFRITDQTPLIPWSDRWRCLMCPLGDSSTERTTDDFDAWLRTRPIMIPAASRPGDILVKIPPSALPVNDPTEHGHLDRSALVLRKIGSATPQYEIIGHALFFPLNDSSSLHAHGVQSVRHLEFCVYVDDDDLMFWVWQQMHWGSTRCETLGACEQQMNVFAANFCHSPFSSFAEVWPRLGHQAVALDRRCGSQLRDSRWEGVCCSYLPGSAQLPMVQTAWLERASHTWTPKSFDEWHIILDEAKHDYLRIAQRRRKTWSTITNACAD